MKKIVSIITACVLAASVTPAQAFTPLPRTDIDVRDSSGQHYGWNNHTGPGLSLVKLYLGYWVLHNGSEADRALVEPMIRTSDDSIANHLNGAYPQAISEVVRDFGLQETTVTPHWGNSGTSMSDVTYFLYRTESDPVAEPLRQGMRSAAPLAADGYPQNYGTATLPGVEGTKFGWSDDRTNVNATASFGPGFYVAARTYGPAEQLTTDVQGVPVPATATLPAALLAPEIPGVPPLSSSVPPMQLPVIPAPQLPPLPGMPPLS